MSLTSEQIAWLQRNKTMSGQSLPATDTGSNGNDAGGQRVDRQSSHVNGSGDGAGGVSAGSAPTTRAAGQFKPPSFPAGGEATQRNPTITGRMAQAEGSGDGSQGGSDQSPPSVSDPEIQKLVEDMDADADDALAEWKSQGTNGVFGFLAPELRAEYSADGAACSQAKDNFTTEWDKIVFGGGDPEKLFEAWQLYALRLGALQEANALVEALIDVNVESAVKALLGFVLASSQRLLAFHLKERIAALRAKLDEARSTLTKAKWRAFGDAVVDVVAIVVVPEDQVARVAFSLGKSAVRFGIHKLTASPGDSESVGLEYSSGDGMRLSLLSQGTREIRDKLRVVRTRINNVAKLGTDAIRDLDQIDEDKKIVEAIETALADLQAELDKVLQGVVPLTEQLISLDTAIRAVNDALTQSISRVKDAAKQYVELEAALQELAHKTN